MTETNDNQQQINQDNQEAQKSENQPELDTGANQPATTNNENQSEPQSENQEAQQSQANDISEAEFIAKFFNSRDLACNKDCKFYPCWAEPIAKRYYNERCFFSVKDKHIKKAFINIMMDAEHGLNRLIIDCLSQYVTIITKNPARVKSKELKDLILILLSVKKSVYGNKFSQISKYSDEDDVIFESLREVYSKTINSSTSKYGSNKNRKTNTDNTKSKSKKDNTDDILDDDIEEYIS